MIATGGFVTALKRTKFVFGRGFAPDPAGGAYSAPLDPLAGLRGPTFKGEGKRRGEGKGRYRPLFANSRIRPWFVCINMAPSCNAFICRGLKFSFSVSVCTADMTSDMSVRTRVSVTPAARGVEFSAILGESSPYFAFCSSHSPNPFLVLLSVMPDFQRCVSVAVTVAVAVSVKTVSVQAVYAVAAGSCARQQRGRPRSQGAEFPTQKSGLSSRRVRTADTEK